VRQYKSNQDGLILVVNFGDEPVLIPADVENRASPVQVSVPEHLPRFSKVPPPGSLRHAIPGIQHFLCIRVSLPELPQSFSADDMQGEPFSAPFLFDAAEMVTENQARFPRGR
jgi:hypothetical protein